jgi:hypothetical protein
MKRAIASASLLALGAVGATAQLVNADKPWSISGSLRGFYDDNINTAPSGPARVDSFGFDISPSAAINFVSGPTSLKGSYAYDNRYYFQRRNTDQSHDFEMDLEHSFSARYSASLSESFVLAQEPEILSGTGAAVTPLRSNGNNIHNHIALNIQAQLTRLFGVIVGYNNDIFSFDENAGNTVTPGVPSRSALLDFIEHAFNIDTTWTLTEKTRGIFGYRFSALYYTSDESVENSLATPPVTGGYPFGGNFYFPSDSRNNYSHYVYIGADHTFNPYLSGSVRVGLQYVDYYQTGLPDALNPAIFDRSSHSSVSPYADLSLNYAYANSGQLTFGFHHSHNQTDLAANAVDPTAGTTLDEESSVVYLTASQQLTMLTPKLTASGSLQYQNSSFNGGPSNDETDNFILLGLDLAYQFNPHLSAETGYNFDLLSSDIAGRGYDRNQIFVGIKATY